MSEQNIQNRGWFAMFQFNTSSGVWEQLGDNVYTAADVRTTRSYLGRHLEINTAESGHRIAVSSGVTVDYKKRESYLPLIHKILKSLKKDLNLYHNDVLYRNFVFNPKKNRLYIIDFESVSIEKTSHEPKDYIEINIKNKLKKTKKKNKKDKKK